MSKTVVRHKCDYCKAIFNTRVDCENHEEKHRAIQVLEGAFPDTRDNLRNEVFIQRTSQWLEKYKDAVLEIINKYESIKKHAPWSYVWFRILDDGGNIFYKIAMRTLCICPKCFKEYNQPYFGINCCKGV